MFSNLATSIDGKIACADRKFFSLGSARDLHLLRKLRDDADAIVFGSGVLRHFRKPCLPLHADRVFVNAVVSRRLDGIDPRWPFFKSGKIRRILYVTEAIPKSVRAKFESNSEIVRISAKDPATAILRDFRRRKFSRVGVEGGGEIMWPFVKANLIDEYFVTLTPRLVGGKSAPTLVDGEGFTPTEVPRLRLKSCRRIGDELFLVYARRRDQSRI